jgi:hypothetical protein
VRPSIPDYWINAAGRLPARTEIDGAHTPIAASDDIKIPRAILQWLFFAVEFFVRDKRFSTGQLGPPRKSGQRPRKNCKNASFG